MTSTSKSSLFLRRHSLYGIANFSHESSSQLTKCSSRRSISVGANRKYLLKRKQYENDASVPTMKKGYHGHSIHAINYTQSR